VKGTGDLWLVGSHGAEFDSGFLASLPARVTELLGRVLAEVVRIAGHVEGAFIEEKPASVAFHWRNADAAAADRALEALLKGPASWDGVHSRPGLKVMELSVVPDNKGKALAAIQHRVGATVVIFIGDDATDEDAFGVMGTRDLSIKIGEGPTRAAYRIAAHSGVADLLAQTLALRKDWIAGRNLVGIERHSMLSDQRTAAIVDPRGRIVWLCLPRIDSGALFAELLGGPSRGYFEVRPGDGGGTPPEQSYVGDTFLLQTRWPGLTVTDYFDCSGGRPFQRAGRSDLIRCIEGSGRVLIRFAPRLDFGRVSTRIVPGEGGLEIEGSPEPIVLSSPGVQWKLLGEGIHTTAEAEVTLGAEPLILELRYGSGNLRNSVLREQDRRRQTERFWAGWAGTLRAPAEQGTLVRRSALVLKALCHGPSGAIVAAATTSLPEQLGGVRNWDYRYCWPRDSALSAAALLRLGNTGTAMKLLNWLVEVVFASDSPDRLRPIYEVDGRSLGPEAEIGDLAGYGGSRPVRVGNAAASQVQLDVFGPIVDLVALLAEQGAPVTPESWRLVEAMVEAVRLRWREPDHGIWEVRGPRRHHVHSKVMCWHAVDRAMVVAEYVRGRAHPDWAALRDEIGRDVVVQGWNERLGSFTGTYGGTQLDAAVLHIGLTGMLAPTDPRFISTVAAVEKDLRDGPVVYRYREDDGLPGIEGGMHICTFWLVEAMALVGRFEEAKELFNAAVGLAGPTGMLSEEYEPHLKLALGNIPQAYSHLGLIGAAVRLSVGRQ